MHGVARRRPGPLRRGSGSPPPRLVRGPVRRNGGPQTRRRGPAVAPGNHSRKDHGHGRTTETTATATAGGWPRRRPAGPAACTSPAQPGGYRRGLGGRSRADGRARVGVRSVVRRSARRPQRVHPRDDHRADHRPRLAVLPRDAPRPAGTGHAALERPARGAVASRSDQSQNRPSRRAAVADRPATDRPGGGEGIRAQAAARPEPGLLHLHRHGRWPEFLSGAGTGSPC